jgi:hypothetical protein
VLTLIPPQPLNQHNDDPVSDFLYTSNFALLGLHEAAAALGGDPQVKDAEDRLADYIVRLQARSTEHPDLDGAFFRAFDYEKWEAWASDADVGWGAWSVESGWTQSWITITLGMRQLNTTLCEGRPLPHAPTTIRRRRRRRRRCRSEMLLICSYDCRGSGRFARAYNQG